jgi:hypothetical protein
VFMVERRQVLCLAGMKGLVCPPNQSGAPKCYFGASENCFDVSKRRS